MISLKLFLLAATTALAPVSVAVAQDKPVETKQPADTSIGQLLGSAGRFTTFLELMKIAGIQDDGLRSASAAGVTVFAPNDASFAKLDPALLSSLRKDPAKAKAFVMGHILPGKVAVLDMFDPTKATSSKTFTALNGSPVGLLCNGHTGKHYPRINGGKAQVTGFQDLHFDGGLVHEVDGIVGPD